MSIIIPVHNAAPFIGDALAGLAHQLPAAAGLEVIVVDDRSSDGSADIAAQVGVPGASLQITSATERGVSAARNTGLALATGRLIGFLDADDWFAPGRLDVLRTAIDRAGADFVRTDVVLVSGRNRSVLAAPQARRGVRLAGRSGILPATSRTMVDHPAMFAGLFHRRLLDAGLLRFDEDLPSAEDRELIWRLHLADAAYVVVDAPGAFYRRGLPRSLTQADDWRRLGYLAAHDAVRVRLEGDPDAERLSAKLVASLLALTVQHLAQTRRRAVRAALIDRAAAVLAAVPEPAVINAVHQLDADRRGSLAPVLRRAGVHR
ncbi:MAG: glycosyltransferase [Propionibacteriales bacterium]|nr:glycosyltransferase [Propionibacteriales bacterium]